MTDLEAAGQPEPSNADLLAFLQSAFAHLTTEISGVKADVADVKADLGGVREELRGEIRASEARVGSRLASLQQVVQSLKTDVARHDDGHPHAA